MSIKLVDYLTLILLSLAMIFTTIRLLRGPSTADRIVAMDLLGVIVVAMIVSISIIFHQPVYLDVASCMAIFSFIGTIALARFLIENKGKTRPRIRQAETHKGQVWDTI